MIITVSLVNSHHLIDTKRKRKNWFFSLWWELLGFTLLAFSNFQICQTVMLTVILYIISPVRLYLVSGSCTFWPPSNSPPLPQPSIWVSINMISFSMSLLIYLLISFYNLHIKWDHTVFSFSDTSLSLLPSRSSHIYCHIWQDFLLCYGWMVFHSEYKQFFNHSSINTSAVSQDTATASKAVTNRGCSYLLESNFISFR